VPVIVIGFFSFFLIGPEAVAGAVDENVFERGLADGDGLNFAGKGFDRVGDEAVAVLTLQADLSGEDLGIDLEALADTLGEQIRVGGVEQDDIATNFALEIPGRPQGDKLALIENGQAVATFGFFHQVGGDDDSYFFLVAEDLEVLPEIAAGAGVESGGGALVRLLEKPTRKRS